MVFCSCLYVVGEEMIMCLEKGGWREIGSWGEVSNRGLREGRS